MATAFISLYEGENGTKDIAQLQERMSSLAESNGERIDHWLKVDSLPERRSQDVLFILHRLERGDSLYVEGVSCLGSSLDDVLSVLREFYRYGISVYGTTDGFAFDRSIDPRVYLAALEQVCNIQRSMLSIRTREALERKRKEGVKLGRPVGTDGKMKILRRNRAGVLKAIDSGMSYMDICRKYKVSFSTLRRFREEEGLLSSQTPGTKAAQGQQTYVTPSARSAAVLTRDILCQSGEEEVKQ